MSLVWYGNLMWECDCESTGGCETCDMWFEIVRKENSQLFISLRDKK